MDQNKYHLFPKQLNGVFIMLKITIDDNKVKKEQKTSWFHDS